MHSCRKAKNDIEDGKISELILIFGSFHHRKWCSSPLRPFFLFLLVFFLCVSVYMQFIPLCSRFFLFVGWFNFSAFLHSVWTLFSFYFLSLSLKNHVFSSLTEARRKADTQAGRRLSLCPFLFSFLSLSQSIQNPL